jgi:hypothetical protein
MEPLRRIKLKPESIRKNMNVKIQVKDNKSVEGFFKKFMHKNTEIPDVKK